MSPCEGRTIPATSFMMPINSFVEIRKCGGELKYSQKQFRAAVSCAADSRQQPSTTATPSPISTSTSPTPSPMSASTHVDSEYNIDFEHDKCDTSMTKIDDGEEPRSVLRHRVSSAESFDSESLELSEIFRAPAASGSPPVGGLIISDSL